MPAGPERAASDTPPSLLGTGWCIALQRHHYNEEGVNYDHDQHVTYPTPHIKEREMPQLQITVTPIQEVHFQLIT